MHFFLRAPQVLLLVFIAAYTLTFASIVGIINRSAHATLKHTASTPVRSLPATSIASTPPTLPSDWVVLLDIQKVSLERLLVESTASLSVAAAIRDCIDELATVLVLLDQDEDLHVRSAISGAQDSSEDVVQALSKLGMDILNAVDWIMLIYHNNRRDLYPMRLARTIGRKLRRLSLADHTEAPYDTQPMIWAHALVFNINSIVARGHELRSFARNAYNDLDDIISSLMRKQIDRFDFPHATGHGHSVLPLPSQTALDSSTLASALQSVQVALERAQNAALHARLIADSVIEDGESLQQDMALALGRCANETVGWQGSLLPDIAAQFAGASIDISRLERARRYAWNKTSAFRHVMH